VAPSSATAPSATTPQPSSAGTPAAPVQAHAEIPAIFSVLPSGSLSPSTVSVPARLAIDLTVVSHDGRRHTAVLRSAHGLTVHGLTVPAGGRASVLVAGLRPGRYALQLDGADRGALVVGVGPGP